MSDRGGLLEQLVREIEALVTDRPLRVGIDGVDGAGKTSLADELAQRISAAPVIRASVDDFHRPRAHRYARGRDSPKGFFLDSFDYARLRGELLAPLGPGGSLRYRTRAFDHRSDRPVEAAYELAPARSILLLDGIFLHRDELRECWDYSVFLDVSSEESVRRCVAREAVVDVSLDPEDPAHRRYVEGQRIYLERCRPAERATRHVDNESIARPRLRR